MAMPSASRRFEVLPAARLSLSDATPPWYRLKTPSHHIAMVLSARASGLDASAAERVFGYRQATITHWLSRAARARSVLARALLPHPRDPPPPVGRTAHQAALRHTGAVAGH
jgi:hypothetical protein